MPRTDAYRERLLPRWWAWLFAVALVLMLAVAYGAALGASAGWLMAIGGIILTVFLLLLTAPRVAVTGTHLEVDGARLPVTSIASVEDVDAGRIRELRGPGSDARLFVALRPWSCSTGVLVLLDDPDDPHPAWLFSSRHPARVVAAITATMGPDPAAG
jgi:hypothetical protein